MVILCPIIILAFIITGERTGGRFAYFCLDLWIRTLNLSGIRFSTEGREKLEKGKAYVYVPNHMSYMDPPAMIRAIPGQFRPLGKDSLTKIPFFGWMYKRVVITLNRDNARSRAKSVQRMQDTLDAGISVLVFPEGKINETKETLLRFYDGAFRIAIATGTPVVPVTIMNTDKIMPDGNELLGMRPGIVKVEFHDPVPTEGLTQEDLPEIRENIRSFMLQTLERKKGLEPQKLTASN